MAELPVVSCLMPVYGKPRELIANAMWCFAQQDYAGRAELLVLDDAGQFLLREATRELPGDKIIRAWSCDERFSSLPDKYDWLASQTEPNNILLVWDDDDVYLPSYVTSHVNALNGSPRRGWSHPETCLSDTAGEIREEPANGRFHGSVALWRGAWKILNGWVGACVSAGQDPRTERFDQIMIAALRKLLGDPGRPASAIGRPQYVFRWASTSAPHAQNQMSRVGASATDWYDNVHADKSVKYDSWPFDNLFPDEVTRRYYDKLR